jgi:hypothetical protein
MAFSCNFSMFDLYIDNNFSKVLSTKVQLFFQLLLVKIYEGFFKVKIKVVCSWVQKCHTLWISNSYTFLFLDSINRNNLYGYIYFDLLYSYTYKYPLLQVSLWHFQWIDHWHVYCDAGISVSRCRFMCFPPITQIQPIIRSAVRQADVCCASDLLSPNDQLHNQFLKTCRSISIAYPLLMTQAGTLWLL